MHTNGAQFIIGPPPLLFCSFARATRQTALALLSLALLLAVISPAARAQSALDGFDPNVSGGGVSLTVIQADGKILIGGSFTAVQGVTRKSIARLNADGTLDMVFNPDGNGLLNDNQVRAIAVQSDGKILVGGDFLLMGGQFRKRLARLDGVTGAADSFNPRPSGDPTTAEDGRVLAIAVQPDGNILVGGYFNAIAGTFRDRIARLTPTGAPDDSFAVSADDAVGAILLQADGKILVGGSFGHIGGGVRQGIARLTPTGGADSFNPFANGYVNAIAMQADGKILASGNFTNIGGEPRNSMARLDAISGAADSFNPNPNNLVGAIAVQSDGKILIGGVFTNLNGNFRNRLARLDASGVPDGFNPNVGGVTGVSAIAVQPDGKILAGGTFTQIGGLTRNRIARVERDGRIDQTLNLNAVGTAVYATALQVDGKILIGGDFTTVLGVARNHIARVNTDGTLETAFNPNANNEVYAIALQSDGKIVVGGGFTSVSPNGGAAVTRNRIARFDPNGTLDPAFDPNVNNTVYAIALQPDGKILAGGLFTSFSPNGGAAITRSLFARLSNDTDALSTLAVTQTTLTLTRNGAADGANYTLTGVNLPTRQNLLVRARGFYRTGYQNGSESMEESVRNAFLLPG